MPCTRTFQRAEVDAGERQRGVDAVEVVVGVDERGAGDQAAVGGRVSARSHALPDAAWAGCRVPAPRGSTRRRSIVRRWRRPTAASCGDEPAPVVGHEPATVPAVGSGRERPGTRLSAQCPSKPASSHSSTATPSERAHEWRRSPPGRAGQGVRRPTASPRHRSAAMPADRRSSAGCTRQRTEPGGGDRQHDHHADAEGASCWRWCRTSRPLGPSATLGVRSMKLLPTSSRGEATSMNSERHAHR